MKIIDHTTKKLIGEVEFVDFSINDSFGIPLNDRTVYFLVTDINNINGSITVFEISKEQYQKGMKIKDVLI